ncbi:hypothetical protein MLD38_034978 [Melastoma candidum]|uniref:Uncharacterized protein n=1 Tax=Melastoma candidum TaxID=119954 RepID=A0ACB9MD09_9MYRT|nr:hypothetical protein MLD38_034978 [Melastoma candidum]
MRCSVPERARLHAAMLALKFGSALFNVVLYAVLNAGTSKIVLTVYNNAVAFLLLLPFAYLLEKDVRPRITVGFLIEFFLLALVGITANQAFFLLGLDNTSPTLASAIQNSIPAITFLMAAILRIEEVRLDRKDGLAKAFGTAVCVAGTSIITLYKGPVVYSPTLPFQTTNIDPYDTDVQWTGSTEGKNWTLGCIYLIAQCLACSSWFVMQVPLVRKYPAQLSIMTYASFFGMMQFLVISVFLERNPGAWHVHSRGELFVIFYTGVAASGASALQIWCIDKGGPVFVAIYQPVQTLIAAILAPFALREEFYLGGVIGAVLTIVGLYLVLWGMNKERNYNAEDASFLVETDHESIAAPPVIEPSVTLPLLRPPSRK